MVFLFLVSSGSIWAGIRGIQGDSLTLTYPPHMISIENTATMMPIQVCGNIGLVAFFLNIFIYLF